MIRKISIISLFLTTALSFTACTGDEKEADSKVIAEERNDAKFSAEEKSVADFMVDVADIVLCEIKISSSAAEKGSLQFTKDYATKMIETHKKVYEEIKTLAAKKSITIPTDMSKEAIEIYESIKEESVEKFDEVYCAQMISSHKETISKFEKAAKDTADLEIQTWAQNILPKLRMELDEAYACEDAHTK